MRQEQKRSASARSRFVLTAIIALGIALVDLSAVWAQIPQSPPPSSEALAADRTLPYAPAYSGAGSAGAVDGVAVTIHSASERHVLANCLTSDCRPGATLLATSRPHAAISRFFLRGEPDVFRIGAPQARLAPLSTRLMASHEAGVVPLQSDQPQRPARKAGANRSVPRPPPIPVSR